MLGFKGRNIVGCFILFLLEIGSIFIIYKEIVQKSFETFMVEDSESVIDRLSRM